MADPKQDPPQSPVEAGWEEPPESVKQTVAESQPMRPRSASRPHLPGLPPDQNSLALLAKDLMPPPAQPQVTLPEVPAVTDRKVQFPGVWITVRNWVRRYVATIRANKMIALAITGTLLVVIILAIALTRGGEPKESRGAKLAK